MNRPIRRMAIVLFATFGVLLVALSYVQVIAGPRYRDDPRNARVALNRAGRERGAIATADGVIVARSIARTDDPRIFQRSYPHDAGYAHTVGYTSLLFGSSGLEKAEGSTLTSGRNSTISALLDVLTGGDLRAQGLRLSIDHQLQEAARDALGDQRGAVVAVDPRTGAVLALVSHPDFDPNTLVGRDAADAGEALENDPDEPLRNRVIDATYPPGSVFKIISTAAALEEGRINSETTFPDIAEMPIPGTDSVLPNFDREPCGDEDLVTLATAFERSCNTVFAAMGIELGAESIVEQAEAFGFNNEIPFELDVIPSVVPPAEDFRFDLGAVAQTAIGQRDVQATPLQMALVAAGVANDGVVMAPYLVDQVINADGDIVEQHESTAWRRAISPATAETLTDLMERVVTSGTGRQAAVPGVRVAGKTGTAEVGGQPPHAWFVGFAPIDATAGEHQIAVAVVVESGGEAGESATGGTVAAPIARRLFEVWTGRGD